MILAQIFVVLLSLIIGIRLGGVAIGASCVCGVFVLVLIFRIPPSSPPFDVIFIILAVITASATLQAAGGVDLLLRLAERLLRRSPQLVTFIAPVLTYVLTLLAGTGYVAYTLLPIIADVAVAAGVRPERPLSISVVASQLAITASPISAATVAMVALLGKNQSKLGLADLAEICIPATLFGVILGAIAVCRRGAEINADALLPVVGVHRVGVGGSEGRRPGVAVVVFLLAVACVVVFGTCERCRPSFSDSTGVKRLGITDLVEIVMWLSVVVNIIVTKCDASQIVKTPIMHAGITAIVSIFGVAWLGDCFFWGNERQLVSLLSALTRTYPILFPLSLFALSALLYSQAATVAALMGLGFVVGLPHWFLIAVFPAVNGFFVFPTSGTIIAAVMFDRTGSTRIGDKILNHSFMLPGLVATGCAVSAAWVLAMLLLT